MCILWVKLWDRFGIEGIRVGGIGGAVVFVGGAVSGTG